MTDLALVTDHTQQALALLLDQYKGLPRFSALVAAMVNRVQELENTTWDTTNKRLLDYEALDGTSANAVASQLDAIGRAVGQARQGQDDATYLIYIRARIFLNKSRVHRAEIVRLIQLIESAALLYTEYFCTVVLEFTSPPATSPAVLYDIAKDAVTAGVQLFLIYPTSSSDFTLCAGATPLTDAAHGLADTAGTTGGYLAGAL